MIHTYFDQPRLHCLGALVLIAIIELSLTASRISHTKFYYGSYEGTVAGLLATSILTLLWAPYAAWTQLGRNILIKGREDQRIDVSFQHQVVGHFILWFMWLVCTAAFAGEYPSTKFCPMNDQCSLLAAIQAFGWIAFTLFSVINVMILVHAMIVLDRSPHGRQTAALNGVHP